MKLRKTRPTQHPIVPLITWGKVFDRTIKASIGIAIYPEHGASGEQLIAKADAAMYLAKQRSRGVAFFDRQKLHAITG
jgi:predicted signal transduction protein with EAL and GGDEF domain